MTAWFRMFVMGICLAVLGGLVLGSVRQPRVPDALCTVQRSDT
jgi:hypothetical protein